MGPRAVAAGKKRNFKLKPRPHQLEPSAAGAAEAGQLNREDRVIFLPAGGDRCSAFGSRARIKLRACASSRGPTCPAMFYVCAGEAQDPYANRRDGRGMTGARAAFNAAVIRAPGRWIIVGRSA